MPPPSNTYISQSAWPLYPASPWARSQILFEGNVLLKHCLQTTGPGCDHRQPVSLLTQALVPRTRREHGPPWKCPSGSTLHVVAGCYCIDRPIPSDFPSLSDKGQKSNDKVADLFAWEECQAGGALEITEGGGLGFHQPPTLFPALKLGVRQPPDVDVWLLWKTR